MFSDDELSAMQDAQEAHMMDEVIHLVWSSSKDALNADVSTWTVAAARLPCGIDMTGGNEQRDGGRTVENWNLTLRLPLGTAFDMRDRFQISKRFGRSVLNGTIYEIISPAEEGPSGIVVRCMKIDPSE